MEPVAAAHYLRVQAGSRRADPDRRFRRRHQRFFTGTRGPRAYGVAADRPRICSATAGIGLAGDSFDAKMIRNIVSPALGAGSQIQSMNKILPVPNWVYFKLERWHHLSFLRTKEVMNMLKSVKTQAFYPERIDALIDSDSGGPGLPITPRHPENEMRFVEPGDRAIAIHRWLNESATPWTQRPISSSWIARRTASN